jgi:hypothetical protein
MQNLQVALSILPFSWSPMMAGSKARARLAGLRPGFEHGC